MLILYIWFDLRALRDARMRMNRCAPFTIMSHTLSSIERTFSRSPRTITDVYKRIFTNFLVFKICPIVNSCLQKGRFSQNGYFLPFFMFSALKIKNMMVTHQKMIVFASSIGFTAPWNIVERYSSKNCFKKVQIPKIPPWHKEGCFWNVLFPGQGYTLYLRRS